MNVLILCEKSQTVCIEFRKLQHNAYSVDLQNCSGRLPQYHLKMDCFDAIKIQKWELIILHPPCTALCVSGNAHYGLDKPKYQERINAIKWTLKLWSECIKNCNAVCMENPVGVLSNLKELPKPQYIQPYQFGHPESKKTGLWLYGLPGLLPTKILNIPKKGYWNNQTPSGQNKLGLSKDRSEIRSKTYQGIAQAMAEQWGGLKLQ